MSAKFPYTRLRNGHLPNEPAPLEPPVNWPIRAANEVFNALLLIPEQEADLRDKVRLLCVDIAHSQDVYFLKAMLERS